MMVAWGRRRLGRAAAGMVAALGAGGCALNRAAGGGPPAVAHGVVTVTFSPWSAGSWTPTIQRLLAQAVAPFEAANRGLKVQLVPPPGGCCNPAALTAALVAGTAPDIVLNNNFGGYAEGGYFLPLDGYLRRDNIDVRRWSPAQIASFRSWKGGQLLALPTYYNTAAYLVNLTTLDNAGMAYPDPAWTHDAFLGLARRLSSNSGGKQRFGCNLWYWTGQAWGSDWIYRAFGGSKVEAGGMRCGLAAGPSQAAGDWIYPQILWSKVGTTQDTFGGYTAQFVTGRTAMSVQQTGTLLAAVTQLAATSTKWEIYPFPVFPSGRASFGGDQFYAISSLTRHPEQAWALLRWLSAETQWQKAAIRIFLMAPALLSLWPEWISIVQSVAPPLHGKQVQWFADAAVRGYAYPTSYFRYVDAAAETIIQGYFADLAARRTSVRQAFTSATKQVDALELANAKVPSTTLSQQRSAGLKLQGRIGQMFVQGS